MMGVRTERKDGRGGLAEREGGEWGTARESKERMDQGFETYFYRPP